MTPTITAHRQGNDMELLATARLTDRFVIIKPPNNSSDSICTKLFGGSFTYDRSGLFVCVNVNALNGGLAETDLRLIAAGCHNNRLAGDGNDFADHTADGGDLIANS